MERDNFYILLGLSLEPPETNDEVIWGAIQKKKSEWSRLKNHPTKGLQAQKYIGLIPEIQRVMMNMELRQKEAMEAIQIIKQGKVDKYFEIDRHMDILMGKGFLEKEEIKKLAQIHHIDESDIEERIQFKIEEKLYQIDQEISIRMAKGYITEADLSKIAGRYSFTPDQIRERVRCPIVKDDTEKVEPPRPLEKAIEKGIIDNLKIIKKMSLYDFLGAPVSAELKTLQEKAVLKKKELSDFSKKDADITAGIILAGHCLTIFKNDETRYAYDVSLANARLASLYSDIDMAASDGNIRLEYFDILTQKAMEFGMDAEEASQCVESYCKSKNYQIEKKEPAAETQDAQKIKKPVFSIKIIGIAAFIIIALAVVLFVIHQKTSASSEYQSVLENAEKQPSLEEKEKLLKAYLNTHKQQNKFTQDAAARIKQIEDQTIEREFDKAIAGAEKSVQSGALEQAIGIYQEYLKSNPPEAKKNQITESIKKLSEQIEKKDFDAVSAIALQGEPDQKMAAFQEFIAKHPKGAHKVQVENFIKDMSGEYFIFVQKKLAACEQNQDWQGCIDLCQNYIKIYDNSNSDQIKQQLPGFEEKIRYEKILNTLVGKATHLGTDYEAAQQVFKDYLAAYPDTPIKLKIQAEITRLKELAAIESVNTEKTTIRNQLSKAGGRFVEKAEGVVADSKTGLMWTLVDGRIGRSKTCINYDEAKKYVEELKTGGFNDWRLPTPGELSGIYQTAPAFPSRSPTDWFWTSENYTSYADGWHVKVNTLGQENNGPWQPQQRDSKECGNVRAVRGK